MKLSIRQEISGDLIEVYKIIKDAFEFDPYSDQKEQLLVENLRNSNDFLKKNKKIGMLAPKMFF